MYFSLILLVSLISFQWISKTSLSGKVTDAETGEELPFANVKIEKNGVLITGTTTDLNGFYEVNLEPGTYDVTIAFVGFDEQQIQGVRVMANKMNKLDVQLSAGVTLSEVVVMDYSVPLVEAESCSQGQTITSKEIQQLPSRNMDALSSSTAGLKSKKNKKLSKAKPRGSKTNPNSNYLDGIRVLEITAPRTLPPPPPPPVIEEVPAEEIVIEESPDFKDQDIDAEPQTDEKKKEPAKEPETGEDYAQIVENKFIKPSEEAFSTFSIDVDNASYSNIRRFITSNYRPPADAVRIEEMINYFNYDYPLPEDEHPFHIETELGDCPWNKEHHLLQIGLQGDYIPFEQSPPNNLVFLIDVSGSMSNPNKLPLLKEAFKILVDKLRPEDKVSIVVYAGAAGLVLPPTSGDKKSTIKDAINRLNAGGSTAGGAGINLAYQKAKEQLLPKGNNRVILATDGDFNVGISNREGLETLIEEKREEGIYISVLGFGMGNYKDDRLETLADKGNGNYAYIDNLAEAKKVFSTELVGTLLTIAKDVKIQIEFNPQLVNSYRLIGYENRMLAKEDFDDDTKDAGELGSAHSVTALYELDLSNKAEKLTERDTTVTIKFRYKPPRSNKSILMKHTHLGKPVLLKATSNNFRFAAAVAGFGMLLRDSQYKGKLNAKMVKDLAWNAKGDDPFGYRSEFIELVKMSDKIGVFSFSNR